MRQLKRHSGEQGAVLVEMAFALPLLALIFVSLLDLGLMIREYQVLQNAAREGARYSIIQLNQASARLLPADQAAVILDIQNHVVQYCAEERITIAATDVTVNQAFGWPAACQSEVTVTYTRPLFLLGRPFLPFSSMTLTGRSVFQNLYGC